jgi:hypothetical protein
VCIRLEVEQILEQALGVSTAPDRLKHFRSERQLARETIMLVQERSVTTGEDGPLGRHLARNGALCPWR